MYFYQRATCATGTLLLLVYSLAQVSLFLEQIFCPLWIPHILICFKTSFSFRHEWLSTMYTRIFNVPWWKILRYVNRNGPQELTLFHMCVCVTPAHSKLRFSIPSFRRSNQVIILGIHPIRGGSITTVCKLNICKQYIPLAIVDMDVVGILIIQTVWEVPFKPDINCTYLYV